MKLIKENRIEKGWMLKMVGISIRPKPGLEITGKNGRYLVGQIIGKGGNGSVFSAQIAYGGENLPKHESYAIKFLTVNPDDVNELEKRRARFIKEIQQVMTIQSNISGIVPIYDDSLCCEDSQDLLWYLMPMAKPYSFTKLSPSRKLEQMLQMGHCIKELHDQGYAHRDIKPKNLLLLEGRLCLSDFGLVWNTNDTDEHITEVNDFLGPQAIRPPELQPVGKIDGVDYRKSDVYLYAKTLWMVLNNNNSGFHAEYNRTRNDVYINKDKFEFETAEPLHCLMEESTKHNYWERPDIDKCLEYIEAQLSVASGIVMSKTLMQWKYMEQVKHNSSAMLPDEKLFKDPIIILNTLNNFAGTAGLVFEEAGKEYKILPLRKATNIQNNLFEIEVKNPYLYGKKKVLELAIEDICIQKDMTHC